jgi:hypothetical protein
MAGRFCGGLEGTMQSNRFSAHPLEYRSEALRAQHAFIEKRRRYNRLYMRSWRADPRHQACERANRERWHYDRKIREALRAQLACADVHADPVCGFCRKSPPITKVWRLEIRDLAPRGFVEVRVPYCGEC